MNEFDIVLRQILDEIYSLMLCRVAILVDVSRNIRDKDQVVLGISDCNIE